MNTLGYRPNLSARRLRTNEQTKPIIALYWPLDYRVNILAYMINAIQNELKRRSFACEFIVQTYDSDHLSENASSLIKGDHNAAILGGLSHKDLDFLSTVPLQIPVVLINRKLEKVSTVCVNEDSMVHQTVSLLLDKGRTELGIICSRNMYLATNQRTLRIIDSCAKHGIVIPDEWILRTENRIDGGVRAAEKLLRLSKRPRTLFCDSDAIAYGLISHLNRQGVHIPDEVELLSMGSMIDSAYTAFSTPSISLIAMPHEQIGMSAISLMIDALEFGSAKPQHIEIEPEILLRESFNLD